MPEVTTRLAWAVPIDPVDLIVYLEAEANFRPVAHTLRLCNVFGKGAKATITKLPKEMVDLIEEFLVADMVAARTERHARCQSLCECFGGLCLPYTKHMTDKQKLVTVNQELVERGSPNVSSLDDHRAADIVNEFAADRDYTENFSWYDCWKPDHAKCIAEWQELVGKVGATDLHQGVVTDTHNFVLKKYGLEIFLAHGQTGENNGYRTLAYLTLPDARRVDASYTWCVCVDDCNEGAPYDHFDHSSPEDSWAHEIAIPADLSCSEKDRCSKMLRSLAMPGFDRIDSSECNEKLRARAMPQMTMLARAVRDVTHVMPNYSRS
ncbi:hypothetical protein LTR56_015069 [Elasticomyces elasticus]|nr:hypothetical protein LTR56_015069 [Elasticomyces elasticus]KAK3639291.1 hypothetical protein LTR22_017492 [Elasticomyces elasticus]KAK4915704.1 hypothetical protein LTR49_016188 [Elasticomyces elasticus]KAK5746291.1 hypothetical protein LTS12_022814 [Elasticomyces elasticus]